MAASDYRTRFAPSPTGYLHLGHAFAAHQVWQAAENAGGAALLRIEDIDQTRCRPDFDTALIEDLRWLGFEWPAPPRRQSAHFDAYEAALDRLIEKGLVYRCFETRKALRADLERRNIPHSPAGERPYPGPEQPLSKDEEAERLAGGDAYAWRLSLTRCRDYLGSKWNELSFQEAGDAPDIDKGEVKAHPDWLGDVVLSRKDAPASYHLAATHDDALQEITHIVRGADLYHATHIHVLLQALFDWPQPVYCHHRLILGPDGRKFSKSEQSKTLRAWREEGRSAEDVWNYLGVSQPA